MEKNGKCTIQKNNCNEKEFSENIMMYLKNFFRKVNGRIRENLSITALPPTQTKWTTLMVKKLYDKMKLAKNELD